MATTHFSTRYSPTWYATTSRSSASRRQSATWKTSSCAPREAWYNSNEDQLSNLRTFEPANKPMHANPVIVKELRGRMRGWGAAIVLTIYMIIVSGIALLFYSIFRATSDVLRPESAQVGKFLFGAVVVVQTLMVSLLT